MMLVLGLLSKFQFISLSKLPYLFIERAIMNSNCTSFVALELYYLFGQIFAP